MNQVKSCFNFIIESRFYIFISILIFFIFSVLGFIYPLFEEQLILMIEQMTLLFKGLNLWQTMGLIFFNNARASLIAIITGVFFGIFPIVTVLTNGYLLGFVARIVYAESSLFELWKILPHGIFELPAVLISIGLGLKVGLEVLIKPTKKNLWANLDNALRTFVLIIIPLLIIAAIIEGFLIFLF